MEGVKKMASQEELQKRVTELETELSHTQAIEARRVRNASDFWRTRLDQACNCGLFQMRNRIPATAPDYEKDLVCVLCGKPWLPATKILCECGAFCAWGEAKGAEPSPWIKTKNGYVPRPPEEQMRPYTGVAVIIMRDSKILMSERLKGNGKGTYGLPGGHLEFGETFERACRRELKEETGLDCGDVKFVTAVNKGVMPESGRHYITLFFSASISSEAVPQDMEPDKHGPWKWFGKAELPKKMFEDFKSIIYARFCECGRPL